jgi:hypothetical protein
LLEKDTGRYSCEKDIMKYRMHIRRNICEYSFNKEYTTMSVFGRHTKLRVFTETPRRKSKLKQFLLRVILSFLSEKGQRIHRMSVTCLYIES